MTKVYAYSFKADENELQALARKIGETVFWIADLSLFRVGKGLPDRWLDRGSVFGRNGEIRWQRTKDAFKLLIITDTDEPPEGHTPIDGDWQATEELVYLQDLKEPRVNPQFESYPHGKSGGLMRIMAVSRNGVPVMMSPRELISGGKPDERV